MTASMRDHHVDSEEAARVLGVSRATLYAYVSRGLVRSEPHPDDPRRQLYDLRALEEVARRKRQGRKPREAAARALDWGWPVLESAISHIDGQRLSYRGTDAVDLSRHLTLEGVAQFLWRCGEVDPFKSIGSVTRIDAAMRAMPLIARCQAALVPGSVDDPTTWRREHRSLWPHAARIVRTLAGAGVGDTLPDGQVHLALAGVWERPEAADLLRRALVLVADHELNASAFAVRVVASTGASLTAAVLGGLATLGGPRHGGQIMMVEELFDQAGRASDMGAFIDGKLRRDERLAGFGHPLYLDADCRAAELLSALPPDPLRHALAEAVFEQSGVRPNIDFALVGMRRVLGLPTDSALFLFLLGRSVGWIAHALEQQADGRVIRPRASYVPER